MVLVDQFVRRTVCEPFLSPWCHFPSGQYPEKYSLTVSLHPCVLTGAVASPAASIQSSDDEFEDAADDFGSHFTVAVPTNHKRTASNASQVGGADSHTGTAVGVSCRVPCSVFRVNLGAILFCHWSEIISL